MDFVKQCFKDNNSTFSNNLVQVGFTKDGAQQFLSKTVSALLNVIENKNLDKTLEILLSANPADLLNSIDSQGMANKLNIDSKLAASGLEIISPEMSRIFLLNSHEVIAATASLAWKVGDESVDKEKEFLAGFNHY